MVKILKGKFLDDLLNNAFSGNNGEDVVEHIDYFLKIIDPIKLPNVNYKRIRLAIFPISLVGNASKWFDEFKVIRDPRNSTLASKFANHMMMDPFTKKVLWDFWIKSDDQEGVVDEGFSDAEEANNDDEQETVEIFRIETNLFDYETSLTKTYKDYENELNDELEEPWSEDGVPYEMYDHICEPFRFKNGKAKWPTCNSNEDEFFNGGELPGMLKRSFGNFHELDYKLLVKLQDYWWKVNDHECSPFSNWNDHIQGPYTNFFTTYDPHLDINSIFGNMNNVQEEERNERCNLFNNTTHNAPVCKIRRFKMIKYSFGQYEEYMAIKECEYDDLTKANEDACQAYQEIFRSMGEGWMVTRAE
ncbi:hypothetical protein Tco_1376671 [Tanacetum coccineum]